MRKILFFGILVVLVVLLITFVFIGYDFLIYNISSFDRTIYSVVLYNTTNQVINNVSILCGKDIKEPETIAEIEKINNLQPSEYRKINIYTTSPPEDACAPYNVHVRLDDYKTYEAAGYFGLETGELAVLSLSDENGIISINRAFEDTYLYKKVHRRHKVYQNEQSWYNYNIKTWLRRKQLIT